MKEILSDSYVVINLIAVGMGIIFLIYFHLANKD